MTLSDLAYALAGVFVGMAAVSVAVFSVFDGSRAEQRRRDAEYADYQHTLSIIREKLDRDREIRKIVRAQLREMERKLVQS
jgi:hypothetical protein